MSAPQFTKGNEFWILNTEYCQNSLAQIKPKGQEGWQVDSIQLSRRNRGSRCSVNSAKVNELSRLWRNRTDQKLWTILKLLKISTLKNWLISDDNAGVPQITQDQLASSLLWNAQCEKLWIDLVVTFWKAQDSLWERALVASSRISSAHTYILIISCTTTHWSRFVSPGKLARPRPASCHDLTHSRIQTLYVKHQHFFTVWEKLKKKFKPHLTFFVFE